MTVSIIVTALAKKPAQRFSYRVPQGTHRDRFDDADFPQGRRKER